MDPKSHDATHCVFCICLTLAFMLGKTVIDKENMSRIFLIWRVLVLKVPCVLLKVRDVDTHFKQNRKQVEKH
jgi:hypothetical protein